MLVPVNSSAYLRPPDPGAPLERLSALCDAGSLRPLAPLRTDSPSSVLAASGRVAGRPVVCYSQDPGHAGGSVGTAEAETVVRALRLAGRRRVPLISFLASAGARLQEGPAALGGFGRIFSENVRLSQRIPQISVIAGTSAGGGCYSPALTDFIVMTEQSAMFLTGPRVVREALGESIDAATLGGARVHERNGVCHFTAPDDHGAATLVRELLGYLPQHAGAAAPRTAALDSPAGDPGEPVPASARQVYDVRDVVRLVVDGGQLMEVAPRWARNIVVGFARLDGMAVGVVANQPRRLGGAIDVAASQKGAHFISTCDAFGLPLVVFVDTPGFVPGLRQEAAGVIRHGAGLLSAFAAARVPRLTVVLRKAYGGAYITMNSKDLGASRAFAWPGAEIGIMGSRAAIQIIHRRELVESESPDRLAERLADEYTAQHLSAARAVELGLIDAVVEPAQTRARLVAALAECAVRRSGPVLRAANAEP
jgi:acetyl-CoA carboxylase carboxyltransferase component